MVYWTVTVTNELKQMLDFIARRIETGMATEADAKLLRCIAEADCNVIERIEVNGD